MLAQAIVESQDGKRAAIKLVPGLVLDVQAMVLAIGKLQRQMQLEMQRRALRMDS